MNRRGFWRQVGKLGALALVVGAAFLQGCMWWQSNTIPAEADSGCPTCPAGAGTLSSTPAIASQWQWPRNNPRVGTNDYANPRPDLGNRRHTGIDVFGTDKNVFAVADGVVEKIFRCTPTTDPPYCTGGEGPYGDNNNMQNVVILRHTLPTGGSIYNNGTVYSLYAHLSSISSSLAVGQTITRGTQLGTTGVRERGGTWLTHVHLEIKNQPVRHNPSGSGQYWGYTPPAPDHPNNYGYWSPWIFIHTISSINPTTGSAGTEVALNGSKFNALSDATNAKVEFGGLPATVLSYSDTQIRVRAPAGSGTVHVRLVPTKYYRDQPLPGGVKNWISFTYSSITVTVPNGGENWPVGSRQTIRWTSTGVTGNVRIDLSRNGGSTWETLFSNTANDGSEVWRVTGPGTTQARIRVVSLNNTAISDMSDRNFTIR